MADVVEWAAALELQQRGKLKAVLPIFVAARDTTSSARPRLRSVVKGHRPAVAVAHNLLVPVRRRELESCSMACSSRKDGAARRYSRAARLSANHDARESDLSPGRNGRHNSIEKLRVLFLALMELEGCKLSYADAATMEPCVNCLHVLVHLAACTGSG